MRSVLSTVFALASALGAGSLAAMPATDHSVVLPDAPPTVAPPAEAPSPPPPPPPPPAGRTHTIWCPSCSGRLHGSSIVWDGYTVVRPCVTCDGSGKLTVAIAPPFVAKTTRQLQRAARRAIARRENTPEALRLRCCGAFPRCARRSMARGMVRTNFNFYGVQLPAEEVLRAL